MTLDPGCASSLKQLHATLDRYAGWLDRERRSVTVREDVDALGAAIDAGADPSSLLQSLDINIARLPSSQVRKMLRAAAVRMRRAIGAPPGTPGTSKSGRSS